MSLRDSRWEERAKRISYCLRNVISSVRRKIIISVEVWLPATSRKVDSAIGRCLVLSGDWSLFDSIFNVVVAVETILTDSNISIIFCSFEISVNLIKIF